MPTDTLLFGEALRSAAAPWRDELGKSDRARLDQLLGLAAGEGIRLSDCLAALFPHLEAKKAETTLIAFRKRLDEAAIGEGHLDLGLRFHVDTKKQLPPDERFCWFTGPDPALARAEDYSEQVTSDVEGKTFVPTRGIPTTGTALASNKRLVRFFISYAHTDKKLVKALVAELRTQFASSIRYELRTWIDHEIQVGSRWSESIAKAITDCDFGLLLISPAFLGSEYVGRHELPPFLNAAVSEKIKPIIPVGLIPIVSGRHDLQGLQEYKLFRLDTGRGEERYYDQLSEGRSKCEFTRQLYIAIEERLDSFFASPPEQPSSPPPRGPEGHSSEAFDDQVPFPDETLHFQRTRGHRLALRDLEKLDSGRRDAPASDALEELESWARSPMAPPFFALLGEYGIGKTTTLKEFTRILLSKRKSDPDVPLPIYVYLRDYVGDAKDGVPTIEQLLASVIQRGWKLRDRTLTPQDVLRLVREEGALILFDGLDEKIVHLPPHRAQDFIRTLWAVLPDAARGDKLPAPDKRPGKLLISCRSHYFPDVSNQNAMLVGEGREGLDSKHFPALCLLPFSEKQIRDYLRDVLGGLQRATEAFEFIASIHDLQDLAERPYLLTLIIGRLGELEELRARGERVNAARLYELVVRSWLTRDNGKHQLDPVHKRRLMEDLAAALWRENTRQWDVERLETWLDEYLVHHPTLASAYANKDRSVLKEDLRTATFVLRPATEEKHFRFAHTSLQEYFLAAYLARALDEGHLEHWDLPGVSRETLDFLGQLLQLTPPPMAQRSLGTMGTLLGGTNLEAAVLAFAYWMRALKQELPIPTPLRLNLAGADLEGWHLKGKSPTQPLNLRGAQLAGVRLNRARVEDVDLTEADLTNAQARQALFLNVSAERTAARGIDFSGLQWREGSLLGAHLYEALLGGCQWIQVNIAETQLPEDWVHHATLVERHRGEHLLTAKTQNWVTLLGHAFRVTACAWSPDGQRLLSGSEDNSLKVWDARSGQCLLILSGHASRVTACAWSPDGQRLLSGSVDNTLNVWDARSGQCLLTLSGHTARVTACAWSPDGQRLLSGSDDSSLKVWDARSGQCLLTLSGHAFRVSACAWSPDGQHLLSGSFDNTLKVWDARSGQCLLTLSGHASWVNACAWSPDGQRILSGSFDNTLKVWDAHSGQCLLTLSGHASWVNACAWSPDGQRILSGSADSSLKVWDAFSGHCLWSGLLLGEGQTASVDEVHGRFLHASPEAWRWLGWRTTDPATQRLRILPAEAFGPLPV